MSASKALCKSAGELRLKVSKGVYEPAEDSWMLAKWVERKARGCRALDVGTGSGIQALAAALGGAEKVFGVDINPEAIECARENARLNGLDGVCSFAESDLLEKVKGRFGLIIFNPPYLPVEKKEDVAWDGGKDGRKVVERFLDGFRKFLNPGGRVLLVQSSLCSVEKTLERLREAGLDARVAEEKNFFFEKISVVEAWLPIG